MSAVDTARAKMMELFADLEATEMRLDNANQTDDFGLIQRVKNRYEVISAEFDEAWDKWNLEISKERLLRLT